MYGLYENMRKSLQNKRYPWRKLADLAEKRADYSLKYAWEGFGIDEDEALELIGADPEELPEKDKEKRKILLAAFDNVIDFAVVAEYQMAREAIEADDIDSEEDDEYDAIFRKYNLRYANVENSDIKYSMEMALVLFGVSPLSILTYMTQGDERVRPWHRVYEGYSATKSHFPAWLVPPIEHQCRCFLIEDTVMSQVQGSLEKVQNSNDKVEMPEWFNPTFKECVGFGGRIFSDEHPYFSVNKKHVKRLQDIADSIKQMYYGSR